MSELIRKITENVERLAELTDDAAKADAMRRYLEVNARFWQYSFNNQFLIAIQRPDATQVAGYHAWINKFGRQVRKGEKGIAIVAPVFKPKGDDGEAKVVWFKTVWVFDVSQTDGDPLPEVPEWKSKERNALLEDRLIAFAASKKIAIQRQDLGGELQGLSMGGTILVDTNAGVKTLVHEIAHEMLHHGSRTDKQTREVEAESVAWVVCQALGVNDLQSPNYLALWDADGAEIKARLSNITATAREIIEAVEMLVGADISVEVEAG